MILEETLNGGFKGLYGEVVTCDCYRLQQVKFQPDYIFDIGANVGVFARFARTLFPNAIIVAVEPHPPNCEIFERFTMDERTILINAALGTGSTYRSLTAANGAGESYVSAGLGFPEAALETSGLQATLTRALSLQSIMNLVHRDRSGKVLMKIDCEGAENVIWGNEDSMAVLRQCDYITMELHDYALTAAEAAKVRAETTAALKSLEQTHHCERDGVYFWATKL